MATIKNPLNELKQADLMALFGKTDRTIQLWHNKGLPRNGEGRGCTYVWADVLAWYVSHISGSGGSGEGASDRSRREKAEADMAELRAAQLAGKLLDAEEVATTWSGFLATLRATLLALPDRVAAQLEELPTEAERLAFLRGEVKAALAGVVEEIKANGGEVTE